MLWSTVTLTSHQRKVCSQILYGDELVLKVAVEPYPKADIDLSFTLMNILSIFSDLHRIKSDLDRVQMTDFVFLPHTCAEYEFTQLHYQPKMSADVNKVQILVLLWIWQREIRRKKTVAYFDLNCYHAFTIGFSFHPLPSFLSHNNIDSHLHHNVLTVKVYGVSKKYGNVFNVGMACSKTF